MSAVRPCCAARPRTMRMSPWWSILPTTPDLLDEMATPCGGATRFRIPRAPRRQGLRAYRLLRLAGGRLPGASAAAPADALSGRAARGTHAHRHAALWRESAPARGVLSRPARGIRQHRRCADRRRARNSRSTTSPMRTPRSSACASSIARPASSSSTPIPAASPWPGIAARGLRAGVSHRPDLGLRRHHRLQPARSRPRTAQADPRPAVRRGAGGAGAAAGRRRGARRASPTCGFCSPASCGRARGERELRSVGGGVLVQDRDVGQLDAGRAAPA